MTFTLNPVHRHCGPGNSVSSRASRNRADRICQIHDIRYGRIQGNASVFNRQYWRPYFYNNDADAKFVKHQPKWYYRWLFEQKAKFAANLPPEFSGNYMPGNWKNRIQETLQHDRRGNRIKKYMDSKRTRRSAALAMVRHSKVPQTPIERAFYPKSWAMDIDTPRVWRSSYPTHRHLTKSLYATKRTSLRPKKRPLGPRKSKAILKAKRKSKELSPSFNKKARWSK